MPPSPQRRRPGTRRQMSPQSSKRRSESSRGSPPPRQKTLPPIMLILLIAVPVGGIIVTLIIHNPFSHSEIDSVEQVQIDPNKQFDELMSRFNGLEKKTRAALKMDRESSKFNRKVEVLKRSWDQWLTDFDLIFEPQKNPDGSWPDELFSYSKYRGIAGQCRLDLIKTGGF